MVSFVQMDMLVPRPRRKAVEQIPGASCVWEDERGRSAQIELPAIFGRDVAAQLVQAVNHQTIANADRFVYSPFESGEISALFKGECQNLRIVVG